MNPRATGILLIITAALAAFVYFYELQGGGQRLEAAAQGERLFDVEAEGVQEISLRTSDGRDARLARGQGSGWQLEVPVDFPADDFSAEAMASALATLRSEGGFENPGPPEEYGLGPEQSRRVGFRVAAQRFELLLGNDAPVGGRRYVSVAGDVHAVARHMVNAFDKSLDDLRNKDILDFDRRRVQRIEARWPEGRVVLEGTPGEAGDPDAETVWRITAPLAAPADQQVVRELLSELDFLRADGFVDEPPPHTGLEVPAFALQLSGPAQSEGEEAFELSFAIGAEQPDGQRLARGEGSALYRIPGSRLEAFPREVFAYRDKELTRFSLADAQRVELFFQQPGGDPVAIVATRDGSDWSSEPEAMDPDRILPMVSELSRLSASAILAESVGDEELVALQLAPPNTIITVLGAAPEVDAAEAVVPKLAELRIGRIHGAEGVVVQRPGDPILYRLPIDVGEQLPLGLEAFRNRYLVPEEPEEILGAAEDDDLLPTPGEESP